MLSHSSRFWCILFLILRSWEMEFIKHYFNLYRLCYQGTIGQLLYKNKLSTSHFFILPHVFYPTLTTSSQHEVFVHVCVCVCGHRGLQCSWSKEIISESYWQLYMRYKAFEMICVSQNCTSRCKYQTQGNSPNNVLTVMLNHLSWTDKMWSLGQKLSLSALYIRGFWR